MPVSHEILASVTRALLGAVDGRGVDRAQLLADAGLSEQDIADPDTWVPIARHAQVGRAIMRALPGENLGLQTGTRIYGDPRGALGYVLRRSSNNQQALRSFFVFQGVVNRAMDVELTAGTAGSSVALKMLPELAGICHPAEALFSAWVGISRHLTGTRWCPRLVTFTHSAQGDSREHATFFGCPVRFEQDQTALIIPAAADALSVAGAPHELDAVLVALGAQSVGESGASETTERLELARRLLADSRLFVFEVAFLLGFGDLRAFEQTFTARHGAAPRSFRGAR